MCKDKILSWKNLDWIEIPSQSPGFCGLSPCLGPMSLERTEPLGQQYFSVTISFTARASKGHLSSISCLILSCELHQEIKCVKFYFLTALCWNNYIIYDITDKAKGEEIYMNSFSQKYSEKGREARCFRSKWQRAWKQKVGGTILKDPLGLLSRCLSLKRALHPRS